MDDEDVIYARVGESVIQGMKEANRDYEHLSSEWVHERGVESFVSAYVSQWLRKKRSLGVRRVLIEATIAELKEKCANFEADSGYFWENLHGGKRIDIVCIGDNNDAIGVVELKRNKIYSEWASDIERVKTLAGRVRCVDFGTFGAFVGFREGEDVADEAYKFIRKQSECLSGAKSLSVLPFRYNSRWKEYSDALWRYSIVGCTFYKPT
ncbi:hypothetical protein [Afifella marina]|uniref:Uncharacterized protein n=1 Tax=Afifella marina DSM 2698 TaxID=1120955 RepID=A0A1G5M9R1_AFIMA|nr:hypothetical protein [Afifella marina]MBK1622812.1 hypothetical protein [Afifella marina DSM 2698]MBK1625807.1 hypothetical protein [Afifella marina]RAI23554.1 hypothetical protein CH311_01360 [Afifella marina DSM 2698]SCZ21524.1 hypothetical protein SAMN03080610_00278 [Afifella marina DSM 2698]